jgi:hypothetical protein
MGFQGYGHVKMLDIACSNTMIQEVSPRCGEASTRFEGASTRFESGQHARNTPARVGCCIELPHVHALVWWTRIQVSAEESYHLFY